MIEQNKKHYLLHSSSQGGVINTIDLHFHTNYSDQRIFDIVEAVKDFERDYDNTRHTHSLLPPAYDWNPEAINQTLLLQLEQITRTLGNLITTHVEINNLLTRTTKQLAHLLPDPTEVMDRKKEGKESP